MRTLLARKTTVVHQMKLPRLQLFEFNDAPWAPRQLKQQIIQTLSRTLRWGGVLRELAPQFERFIARTGANEVLDLASGAGGPAAILARAMADDGHKPPRFLLTDLLPQPEAWAQLKAESPETIDFEPGPVDMTAIPPRLGGNRPRTIINALHHFPPEVARALLRGAAEGASGLFIAEALVRNPARATAIALTGIPALYLNPLLSADGRLGKALWTWPIPFALWAGVWDGAVSSMRTYTEAELHELVQPWGADWEWHSGQFSYPPWGKGTYFWGIPAPHGVSRR
jgi:hypothetical protein